MKMQVLTADSELFDVQRELYEDPILFEERKREAEEEVCSGRGVVLVRVSVFASPTCLLMPRVT